MFGSDLMIGSGTRVHLMLIFTVCGCRLLLYVLYVLYVCYLHVLTQKQKVAQKAVQRSVKVGAKGNWYLYMNLTVAL